MTSSDTKQIRVRGAAEHNLRHINVDIPRDRLVVMTGVSGSGKSSLAFDTIFAEGQRKYMESLSAYARQFLDQLQKPHVESIEGLPPTIAIEQRSGGHNPRSTVATTTEIYDYLRLLYARCGTPTCWHRDEKTGSVCGRPIAAASATQIVDTIMAWPAGARLMICSPVVRGKKGFHRDVLEGLQKQGFIRARVNGAIIDIREALKEGGDNPLGLGRYEMHTIEAVVDRIVVGPEIRQRLVDSVEVALRLSEGLLVALRETAPDAWSEHRFSEKFACPDHPECSLDELEPRLFSFNSPYGACPRCDGLGTISEFDENLIVPDPTLALNDGAIEPWRKNGRRMNNFYGRMIRAFCDHMEIPRTSSFEKLTKHARRILMHGSTEADQAKYGFRFEGVIPNLRRRFEQTESEWIRERMHDYMAGTPCPACEGRRLRTEALHVMLAASEKPGDGLSGKPGGRLNGKPGGRLNGKSGGRGILPLHDSTDKDISPASDAKDIFTRRTQGHDAPATTSFSPQPSRNIADITDLTIDQAVAFFDSIELNKEQTKIAEPILREINARLGFLASVGLNYLTLNRTSQTLSGGEAQRIRLATQVGSGLVGVCYVLDEPTIGLHQRDNDRLIGTLRRLADIGNTVLVVEHDEGMIRAADHIIDVGPGPGRRGGTIVTQGSLDDILANTASLTAAYMSGRKRVEIPAKRRDMSESPANAIIVKGASENNLKSIDVAFPLGGSGAAAGGLICVTGVSGSGKSTLVNEILLKAAKREVYGSRITPGRHTRINGLDKIERVVEVDQSPIGRTPRSNPATYTGIFDDIRKLFATTKEAKIRGYEAGRFSFNVKGGRCEACQGQGVKKIEMHFLPDVFVTCETCKGKRYNRETLEITYRHKTISDVLDMTVEDAVGFFESHPKTLRMLQCLHDVGLDYVQLGQPSTTLSGGEAQRIKLASELGNTAPPISSPGSPSAGGRGGGARTLYVLDEPTTGLHFADVDRLIGVLDRLAGAGHTLVVIEHNLDVIKCADWVIDLGPQGGDRGGTVVATGTPEQITLVKQSFTGQYLKPLLNGGAGGPPVAEKKRSAKQPKAALAQH